MHDYSFLEDLNPKQKEICTSENNFVLTACPGSGKTRTITYRLAYLQQKFSSSRKYNIALTYTNRAAEEIERRLDDMGIDLSYIWTGTIHQFCMCFIIRPYAMYSDRLKKGYHIIDEYVTREYCNSIATRLNINCQFKDPLTFPKIRAEYERLLEEKKEIDFDLILKLSFQLIRDNSFIAENIGQIIRSIHVDEYQDTQEIQYAILTRIIAANPTINLLFVGDVNQAIYGTLGSVAKSASEIRKIYPIAFCEEELDGCYRSTQRLIDYYKQFEVHSTNAHSLAQIRDLHGRISFDNAIHKDALAKRIADIVSLFCSWGHGIAGVETGRNVLVAFCVGDGGGDIALQQAIILGMLQDQILLDLFQKFTHRRHLQLSGSGCHLHDLDSFGQDQLGIHTLGSQEANLASGGVQLVQATEGDALTVTDPVILVILNPRTRRCIIFFTSNSKCDSVLTIGKLTCIEEKRLFFKCRGIGINPHIITKVHLNIRITAPITFYAVNSCSSACKREFSKTILLLTGHIIVSIATSRCLLIPI